MKTYIISLKSLAFFFLLFVAVSSVDAQTESMKRFKLAQAFENNGDFENAARIYTDLFNYNPKIDEYFEGVVRAYNQLSRFVELEPLIEKRIGVKPTPETYSMLAATQWKLGDNEKAGSSWEKAIAQAPRNSAAYQAVAGSQIELRLFPKAISTYLTARDNLKSKDIFADELSRLYIATGDVKNGVGEILNYFKATNSIPLTQGRLSALMTNPKSIEFVGKEVKDLADSHTDNFIYKKLYGWFLTATNRYDEALDIYIQVDKTFNASGREVLDFSNDALKDGKYNPAIKGFEYVIALGRKSPNAVSALYGYAAALQKKFENENSLSEEFVDRVIESYEVIIKEFPRSHYAANAKYTIATIYLNYLDDKDKAIEELHELINKFKYTKTVARGYLKLGSIYAADEDFAKAEEQYKEARHKFQKSLPDVSLEADYRLAELLYYRGNIDSALVLFKEFSTITDSDVANDAIERSLIIENGKDYPEAVKLYAKAEFYLEKRDFPEAISMFTEAAAKAGGSDIEERSIIKAAEIKMKLGAYQAARQMIEDIKDKYDDSLFGDYSLIIIGKSYLKEKNYQAAVDSFKELLVKYPKSIYLEQARENIRNIRSNYLN
jgi:tetratricopeptide (TPR) repeat protein